MNDYDDLPVGRELDVLVAEKVMGWEIIKSDGILWWCDPTVDDLHTGNCADDGIEDLKRWSPSSNIAAAWTVVEKLLPEKVVQIQYYNVVERGWCWVVSIDRQWSYAESVAMAICRAALKAANE